jgi:hypothetical protein
MITAIIVISSLVLAAAFTIAWLTNPALRRQIEHPKHCFQDQVQQYNQQCHDAPEMKRKSDES